MLRRLVGYEGLNGSFVFLPCYVGCNYQCQHMCVCVWGGGGQKYWGLIKKFVTKKMVK
jgi:hypothetical protein